MCSNASLFVTVRETPPEPLSTSTMTVVADCLSPFLFSGKQKVQLHLCVTSLCLVSAAVWIVCSTCGRWSTNFVRKGKCNGSMLCDFVICGTSLLASLTGHRVRLAGRARVSFLPWSAGSKASVSASAINDTSSGAISPCNRVFRYVTE